MISPGALSPPMPSTAMGRIGVTSLLDVCLLDVYRLAAVVPAAVAAHDVGHLGRAATGADAARGRVQRPRGGPPAPALHLRGLPLGDGHSEARRLPASPLLTRISGRRGP